MPNAGHPWSADNRIGTNCKSFELRYVLITTCQVFNLLVTVSSCYHQVSLDVCWLTCRQQPAAHVQASHGPQHAQVHLRRSDATAHHRAEGTVQERGRSGGRTGTCTPLVVVMLCHCTGCCMFSEHAF